MPPDAAVAAVSCPDQVDTSTGELLGNTPQALSHVGLIIAAHALDNSA